MELLTASLKVEMMGSQLVEMMVLKRGKLSASLKAAMKA